MRTRATVLAIGFVCCAISAAPAATSRGEISTDDAPPPRIELRPGPASSPSGGARAAQEQPRGNPLWSIPLSSLTATRERPLFSPSRRPPPPAVAAVPPPPASPAPPPPPAPPEKPTLSLVGTIGNGPDSIAVFVDARTRAVVRLRVGEAYGGWVLRSVRGREAALEKGARSEIVGMTKAE